MQVQCYCCSLRTVDSNTSNMSTTASPAADADAGGGGDHVAHHVTESEFISCHLDSSSLIGSAVRAVTAYGRLRPASSNYLIGERNKHTSHDSWHQRHFTPTITSCTERCSTPGHSPALEGANTSLQFCDSSTGCQFVSK